MGSAASNLFCSYLTFTSWTEHGLYRTRSQLLSSLPVKWVWKQEVFLQWRLCSPSLLFTTFSEKISANTWFPSAVTTIIGPVFSNILEIILHLFFHTFSQKFSTSFFRREGRVLCLSFCSSKVSSRGTIIPIYTKWTNENCKS